MAMEWWTQLPPSPTLAECVTLLMCHKGSASQDKWNGKKLGQKWNSKPKRKEGPQLITRGRMPGRNNDRKRKQRKESHQENILSCFSLIEKWNRWDGKNINGLSSMIILYLYHLLGVFLDWNLPSVFHSCLFQMNVRFRENTLWKKELCLGNYLINESQSQEQQE
jgi:hypothetical protein